MRTDVQVRPYSKGEQGVLLVTRVLTAAFLTAVAGAMENWFYERFFAAHLYAAGPPLARAIWLVAFSFPLILAGLLILGLPTAHLLHRWRAESALTYAAAGAATGAVWGAILGATAYYGYAVSAFSGFCCALFWWVLRPRR